MSGLPIIVKYFGDKTLMHYPKGFCKSWLHKNKLTDKGFSVHVMKSQCLNAHMGSVVLGME